MATYNTKCKNEKCEKSQEITEIKKGMNDPYPPCENCGSEIETVFSSVNFSLKGGGWCGKSRRR